MCGCRLFTLKRKVRHAGGKRRGNQFFSLIPGFFYSIALQNKCVFKLFLVNTAHFCDFEVFEQEEGTFDAPCFSVLTGDLST